LLAAMALFIGRADAGIYLHDGSTAVVYQGGVGTISQPFTVTAGASVMVVCVEECNTSAANVPPATISWNGVLLTNIAYQSPSTTSLFRDNAIYYVYNPPAGSGNITGVINSGGGPGTWVTAYTLGGVNTSAPPLTGSVGTQSNPGDTLSFTVLGITANSWAAVSAVTQGTGQATTLIVNGATTTTSVDNGDNSSTMTAGYINGLAPFVDSFVDQVNETGSKIMLVAAIFAPLSQTGAQQDLWTGANSANWDTTTANWINSLPAYVFSGGDAVLFDNTAAQFAVNVPGAVAPLSLTFSNSAADPYTINGSGTVGGGLVAVSSNGSVTFNVPITFTGPLSINTNASLTLNSPDYSLSGGVTIAPGGSFNVSPNSQLGGNAVNGGAYGGAIVDNGSFTFSSVGNQTLSGVISGGGVVTNNLNGQTLTITGANTTTNSWVINGPGTLSDRYANNSFNTTASAFGNPQIAGKTVYITNGALVSLDFGGGNEFGNGSTIVQMGFVIGQNSTLQITSGNANIGPLTFNGGTLQSTSTAGYSQQYGSYAFGADLNVLPNTGTSYLNALGVYNFNLTVAATTNGSYRTFNVGANSVFNVTAQLADCSNTQRPTELVKAGAGALILNASANAGQTNTYSYGTVVSNGVLDVESGGSGSGPVTVYGPGVLAGSGPVGGSVTVNSGGETFPDGNGTVSILNCTGSLTYNAGAVAAFAVGTVYTGNSDQIVMGGANAVLSGTGAVVGLKALGGTAALDTTADYVLLTNTAGVNILGSFNPTPTWLASTPANAANFSIVETTNALLLHYSPVTVTALLSPNPAAGGTYVTITATASSIAGSIASVTADVSAATNGVSPLTLVHSTGNTYTNSFYVSQSASAGNLPILVTATDSSANANTLIAALTVPPGPGAIEIWNGASTIANTWGTGSNWFSLNPPQGGATVTFAGASNLVSVLEASYSISSLTFSNTAGAFVLTNPASTLTLTGSVTNNSTNKQTLNVPVVLNSGGADYFNASAGGVAFNYPISGGDSVTIVGGATNSFNAANPSLVGPVTNSGNLLLANANALSGIPKIQLNNGSKLLLRSDTTATFPIAAALGTNTLQNASDTVTFDANTNLAAVVGKTLSVTNALLFPNVSSQQINITGNSNFTVGLGQIQLVTSSHNPYFACTVNTITAGPQVSVAGILVGNWGNYLNFTGGGRATVTGPISNTSNGSANVFVNGGTTVTFGPSAGLVKANTGDAYRLDVINGTLVLDNSTALTALTYSSATSGLGFPYFILGAESSQFTISGTISPASGVLTTSSNNFSAAIYLGDANNLTGGITIPAGLTNYVSDGDSTVPFTNTGVLTIGGLNTSGVNTYSDQIVLGMSPNRGKSVTLVAAAGGEVDFNGGIVANGTNTTAGVTVGDGVHTGTVAFTGSTQNTYAGGTVVTNAILRVDGGGSGTGTGALTINNLGRLAGYGPITGNVIVNSGGLTFPSSTNANTGYVNMSLSGNLTFNPGGGVGFNLGAASTSGDALTVASTSVLVGTNATVAIYATDPGHNLDTGSDYVLINGLNGNFATVFTNRPTWLGTPPNNAGNYSIVVAGNQVRLHYNNGGISITGSITPNPSFRGQTVTINVTAAGNPGLQSVTVDASSIGGSSSVTLNRVGVTSNYTGTVTIGSSSTAGVNTLLVTATDTSANQDVVPLLLTTTPGNEIWSGGGVDSQWSTGGNWTAGLAPVAGDTATFAGSSHTTPVMESPYTLSALTFNSTAATFNLTGTGNTLTMTGGITNNSVNTETVGVPITLASPTGVLTINSAAGALIFNNSIGGSGGVNSAGISNVFSGNNSYTGPTTISSGVLVLSGTSGSSSITNNGTLQLGSSTVLGATPLDLNSGSTLRLRGDNNADYTPNAGLFIPIASDTLTLNVDNVTPGVTGKTLSLMGASPIFAFPTNFNHTINVTGNSTYTLALGDILLGSTSHTPYFSLSISTVAGGANVTINSITSGNWGNYVNFTGTGNATVTGDLSNTSNGSLDVVVNGGSTLTLLGSTVKVNTGDAFRYVVENGTLVLDSDTAVTNYSDGTGLNAGLFVLGATTNGTYFQSAGNFLPPPGVLFGTNNAYNAAVYLGDSANPSGGLYTAANLAAVVSDGDVGFTNGGVYTIGGLNTSGVNTYSNNWTLGMTAGGGKSVTLVAASGGEVDFNGNLLANSGNTSAGVTVGDSVHNGVVHLNGINTYAGLTLVTNGTLGGSGTIAGNVSVVNAGHTHPGGGVTNTIHGTLAYATGAEADFDLGASASAYGNDQIILSGASSSLNGGGVSVGVYLTAGDLDQTTDYVLITNLTGVPNTGVFNATPIWKGAQPSAPTSYTIITRGNSVVLHYSTDQFTSGTALPSPVGRGQTVTVTVNAVSSGTVSSVSLNASAIGAGSAVTLNPTVGSTYANTVTVGSAIPGGTYLLPVTVTDSLGGVDTLTLQVTVTSVTEVWNGGGADEQWSTGGNWASGFGPVSGDVLLFAGTAGLTPNIQNNYTINSLTFSNNAGAFNFTNNGSATLTLGGGVTNNSPNTQTFSVPVSLTGAVTLNGAAGGLTLSNTVTGSGSLTSINGTNTLTGNTSYAGNTTVGSGELIVSGTNLFYGAVSVGTGSTMIMSGDEGIGSTLTVNTGGSLQITGAGQLNGGIYGGAIPNGGSLIFSSTNSLGLYGTISGGGSLTLNSGSLTLGNPTAAANPPGETYTGPTVVNGGTLYLGYNNPNTGGGLVTSSSITINNGGSIVSLWSSGPEGYGTASTAAPPLTINAGGLLDVSPLHTVNGSGFSAHIQGLLYLNGGTISNNAAYIQQYGGWGIYTNVYVNGGTNTSVIADFAAVPVSPGGTYFYVTNGGPGQTIPGVDLDVTGGLINCYGTTDTGIIVAGNGTMRLDGTNSYSAGTTITNSATLILGLKGQLNTVTRGNSLGNAAAQANILSGALGGAVYTEIYSSPLTFWNTGTFISTTTNRTVGVQTLSGVIASGTPGAGTLEVSGAGSLLVISGNANTFSGVTIVTNGATLVVSNASGLGTGTNALNIYAGSTLGGPGVIAGNVTNGGYLIPGITRSTVGAALTVSNLTLLASSTNVFAVSHTGLTNDSVIVGGTVTYGGTLTVNASNALVAGDTFTLFRAGAISGSFTTINLPTLTAGLSWVNNLLVNGTISVTAGTPPTAIFSGTPTNAFVLQPVVFANASTGTIATYAWTFGDGGVLNTTSGTNVSHAYTNAGTYTVSLTVTGSAGANTSTLTSYIGVYPLLTIGRPVVAGGNFTFSATSGGTPGSQYRVLTSTNVASPLASWTPVYTNTFTVPNGGYSYSVSPTNADSFFIIVSP
jgi:hypothetical protein